MAQLLLFVLVYHIFGVTVSLLIAGYLEQFKFPLLFSAFIISGCETPPINVKPLPEIAAVRTQNETTRKHITTFSDRNTKTRKHVDKSIEVHTLEEDKLKSALKDLEELLKE